MNGPGCRSRDERTTAMIVNERRKAVEGLEGRDDNVALDAGEHYYRDCRERESAGRRGTGDIEPNASNKANIMELMTGCVSLTLIQAHVNLLRRDVRKIFEGIRGVDSKQRFNARLTFHRLRDLPGKMVAGWRPRVNVVAAQNVEKDEEMDGEEEEKEEAKASQRLGRSGRP
ncbi:hypothetical protein G5I_09846 [Acromyrmex echinatior]|uniref:Uncharacterized protein n=1 Tax=Acromyrmex echinatior TaxID=103372 RepID=F4WV55_ACREC|nr:hypothetical protein G5I_09846 [Acromyrmex echinatior]